MKVSLLEPIGISEQDIYALAKPIKDLGHDFTYYNTKTTDIDELIKRSQNQDVVMIANNPYPKEVIENCPDLKMIAVAFTGIDHVDEKKCAERNILIKNCGGYSDVAVSELVIGLTINLLRNIKEADIGTRNKQGSSPYKGIEIAGKKVGIIGCGKIGTRTGEIFKAMGAEIYAFSRSYKKSLEEKGFKQTDLDTLLKECDIISIHLPNNDETRRMISKDKIALMKQSAILINCARGPIVDNEALAEALNNDEIAGAGIDVYDKEPPLEDNEMLLHAKNTILTPHIGYLTDEAMIKRAKIEFDNVIDFLVNYHI